MNQFSTLVMLDTLSEDSSPSSQFPRAHVCPTENSPRQVPRVCRSLVGAPSLLPIQRSSLIAQWFDGAIVYGQLVSYTSLPGFSTDLRNKSKTKSQLTCKGDGFVPAVPESCLLFWDRLEVGHVCASTLLLLVPHSRG